MNDIIDRLGTLFGEMVDNHNTMGRSWRNTALVREAYALMMQLPDTYEGEFNTPADKADLLCNMLDQVDETDAARFCICIRQKIAELYAKSEAAADDAAEHRNEDNEYELAKLLDFINPDVSTDDYCKKYNRMLRFDPVERSKEWEDVIYDARKEVDEEMGDEEWRMGMCFSYWSSLRSALEKRGVEWRDPHLMNPGVMFD